MNFTSSPVQISLVMASAMLATVIGLLATLRRGHWLTTLLFSSAFLSIAAFQAGTLGILRADSMTSARNWAVYLAGVSALASWLWLSLSVVLARTDPWEQIRNAAAYLTLALTGCVGMFALAGNPSIVRAVEGREGDAVIVLGGMGKIYLMYLVVAMVAVLMNFERMLRGATATVQRRLRAMALAFLVAILSQLMVVSAGLLYGGIRVSWLSMTALPLFAAGVVTSLALARRRLSDMSIPMARPVVYYSSVSLTLAGAFLLSMAVLSRVLPVLSPEWKRVVSLLFYALVGGGGLLLMVSPATSRAIKRFIDRNFYANRYDYRREWERVSNTLTPGSRIDEIAHQIESLMASVFEAHRVAIYLLDESDGGFRLAHGPLGMPVTLAAENPLPRELARHRRPLVFEQLASDLDLLPVAAENREAIQSLSAALCAPLIVGDRVVGMLWISAKRTDEDFSEEDVEFLAAMSRQIAAALWFARQAEQLVETRQLDSLNRLATFVLHDVKNHVSGLSLVLDNARRHMSNPEFQKDALAVIERTVANLREMMQQVAVVSRAPQINPEPCALSQLVDDALAASGLARGGQDGIRVGVVLRGPDAVWVDRRLMQRVLVNLLTNAREALRGPGNIDLAAEVEEPSNGIPGRLLLQVRDDGLGMSEEFIRTSLFRPFATTKDEGLGFGLAQCRSIVEAHGGTIRANSRTGKGTTFEVNLPMAAAGETPGGP
ncbi:MAG: XrtA/PEP-CTERM system histidine kinase PrsK [Candidatus Eisenbacteria bacterium]